MSLTTCILSSNIDYTTTDRLVSENLDNDICVAGALHSVYGTTVFRKVTIKPTYNNRKRIQELFGVQAEKLSYLFHICNRSFNCNDIENGELTDARSGYSLSGITVQDIQALRIMEVFIIM